MYIHIVISDLLCTSAFIFGSAAETNVSNKTAKQHVSCSFSHVLTYTYIYIYTHVCIHK